MPPTWEAVFELNIQELVLNSVISVFPVIVLSQLLQSTPFLQLDIRSSPVDQLDECADSVQALRGLGHEGVKTDSHHIGISQSSMCRMPASGSHVKVSFAFTSP